MKKSWLDKLLHAFSDEPRSRDELLEIIKDAADNKLLDKMHSALLSALDVSSLQAREIMVPRSQITAIRMEDSPQDFLPQVIESGPSRFPVIGESLDDNKRYFARQRFVPSHSTALKTLTWKVFCAPPILCPKANV